MAIRCDYEVVTSNMQQLQARCLQAGNRLRPAVDLNQVPVIMNNSISVTVRKKLPRNVLYFKKPCRVNLECCLR